VALLPGDDGPYVFLSVLGPAARGRTLLDHLAGTFTYQSRETWRERVADGAVRLDGIVVLDDGQVLSQGQELAYEHGHYREPDVPTDWSVALRGEDWMAVHKPAGQPMHSTAKVFRQTLVWQVRKLHGEGWSPCHRLDRDTSGLVLFARTKELLSWIQTAFERRRLSKQYLALVHGHLTKPVTVDAGIGPDESSAIRFRLAVRPDGKECRTVFEPIARDQARDATWCQVRPHQGRRHQIRVHAESIGHPLVGDPLYDGKGAREFLERLNAKADAPAVGIGAERMWLHSCALEFLDPTPSDLPQTLRISAPAGAPEGLKIFLD